jgi:hypothetical protein
MDHPRRTGFDLRRPAAAIAVALIAPAGLFFLAVVGRSLQPIEHEPARTLNHIAQAFLGLPAVAGGLVIVVAPALALLLAAAVVWRTFVTDRALTADIARLARAMVPFLRRPTLLVALVVAVAALAMAVFLAVHAIVG